MLGTIYVVFLVIIAVGGYYFGARIHNTGNAPSLEQSRNDLMVETQPLQRGTGDLQENEVNFSCRDMSAYIQELIGFCKDAEPTTVISTKDYLGDSNSDNKARHTVSYAAKLIVEDNKVESNYEKAVAAFDARIKQYGAYTDDDNPALSLYAAYYDKLIKLRPQFVQTQREWKNLRDDTCSLQTDVISPGAVGTNALDFFERLDCVLRETKHRSLFLEEVNDWLEKSDLNKSAR